MSTFKYYPLIWVFSGKSKNKSINKICKHTPRLIYVTEDTIFEDLLERYKSLTIHEDNIGTLTNRRNLVFKTFQTSPPIMWDFFNLKRNRYNLRGNYLLKVPDTSTCRYDTQALSFKGSLLWNKIPNKYKNLNSLEQFKT